MAPPAAVHVTNIGDVHRFHDPLPTCADRWDDPASLRVRHLDTPLPFRGIRFGSPARVLPAAAKPRSTDELAGRGVSE